MVELMVPQKAVSKELHSAESTADSKVVLLVVLMVVQMAVELECVMGMVKVLY